MKRLKEMLLAGVLVPAMVSASAPAVFAAQRQDGDMVVAQNGPNDEEFRKKRRQQEGAPQQNQQNQQRPQGGPPGGQPPRQEFQRPQGGPPGGQPPRQELQRPQGGPPQLQNQRPQGGGFEPQQRRPQEQPERPQLQPGGGQGQGARPQGGPPAGLQNQGQPQRPQGVPGGNQNQGQQPGNMPPMQGRPVGPQGGPPAGLQNQGQPNQGQPGLGGQPGNGPQVVPGRPAGPQGGPPAGLQNQGQPNQGQPGVGGQPGNGPQVVPGRPVGPQGGPPAGLQNQGQPNQGQPGASGQPGRPFQPGQPGALGGNPNLGGQPQGLPGRPGGPQGGPGAPQFGQPGQPGMQGRPIGAPPVGLGPQRPVAPLKGADQQLRPQPGGPGGPILANPQRPPQPQPQQGKNKGKSNNGMLIGGAAGLVGGFIAGQALGNINQARDQRQVIEQGGVRYVQEPGRTIIVDDRGGMFIRHDENERFRDLGYQVRNDRRNGNDYSTYVGPGGVQIITVTSPDGRLLRRYKRYPNGQEFVIIDNTDNGIYRPYRPGVELVPPPPRIVMPPNRYIVEDDGADEGVIYDTFRAPPVAPIQRRYTLDEIRGDRNLRAYMPSVDINTVNFDTGSWAISYDQANKLSAIAQAMMQTLQQNPNEVYLIEGYTDAVGNPEDNLSLSDRRAQAVADVLTRNFGVPAENLTTQGYGAQYLKVQTDAAERANRRVTVRRVTPLLNGDQQAAQ